MFVSFFDSFTFIYRAMTEIDLDVPSLMSVEYPLRVLNTEKAIELIGGETVLKQCFIDPDLRLQLQLRNDPLSHPIRSSVQNNKKNVLLKFRIPKRILYGNNGDIRKSIKQCEIEEIDYTVKTCGLLSKNFKFREMSDFQQLKRNSDFNNKFNESIRVGDFNKICQFSNEIGKNIEKIQEFNNNDIDLPSLVRFARLDLPYNYKYFGNLLIDEDGKFVNNAVKLYGIQINYNEKPPLNYDERLQPELEKMKFEMEEIKNSGIDKSLIEESTPYHFLKCLEIVRKLFEMKPVWIRRHIHWLLPKNLRNQLRFTLPYVSYTVSKGPFRHSFIKFGYDPSKNKEAYKYQIEAFRGNSKSNHDEEIEKIIANNNTGDNTTTDEFGNDNIYMIPPTLYEYIEEFSDINSDINKLGIGKIPKQLFFDGKNPCNSLSFQLGDILDEDVKKLIKNCTINDKCNIDNGWIDLKSMAKIRSVMKYKLTCVREGIVVNDEKVLEIMSRSEKRLRSIEDGGIKKEEEGEEDGYNDNDNNNNREGEEGDEDGNDNNREDGEEVDMDMDNEGRDFGDEHSGEEMDILERLRLFNPKGKDVLKEIKQIIVQDNII